MSDSVTREQFNYLSQEHSRMNSLFSPEAIANQKARHAALGLEEIIDNQTLDFVHSHNVGVPCCVCNRSVSLDNVRFRHGHNYCVRLDCDVRDIPSIFTASENPEMSDSFCNQAADPNSEEYKLVNSQVLDFVSVDDIGIPNQSENPEMSDHGTDPLPTERAPCHWCGQINDCDDLMDIDDNPTCPACAELTRCVHCESRFDRGDTTQTEDGMVCETCYCDEYFMCERCQDSFPNRRECDVNGESWCVACRRSDASRCADCGGWVTDGDTVYYNGGSLCQLCYDDSYFTCEGCEEVLHNDNYDSDGRCNDCRSSDVIMPYSTCVLDHFGVRIPRSSYVFGIELEVEQVIHPDRREEAASECMNILGNDWCIAKEDGSLGAGGFELVTLPCGIPEQRERWSKLLSRVPHGLRSWNTEGRCGMHVSVSRCPLSQLTIGKLLVFINANENTDLITSIAGRRPNGYCQRSPKKISDAKKYSGRGAINLGSTDRVEFRIFRGTLSESSFMKNLEFADASVKFCKQTGIHNLDTESFLDWFKKSRKDYPSLDAFLINRGYIARRSNPRKGGI